MKNLFTIKYKKQFMGAAKTRIFFYEDSARLEEIFLAEKNSEKKSVSSRAPARRLFAVDSNVAKLPQVASFIKKIGSGEFAADALLVVPAGEENKTIQTVLKIVEAALEKAFSRKDIFTAIGGGVLTDMTAFAAAIYKRGARFEAVPTTLLAMVDAAVGGKSGCDFDAYKNMIGAFMPAERLFVFPDFVQSLDQTQYRSGFAEAFKTALLYDKKMFREICAKKERIKEREPDFVFRMIKACVEAKARIVQKDMTEKNVRMQLNLGHTFGHAWETVAGLGTVAHGDAVAWGIGRAATLSLNLGLCTREYKETVFSLLEFFGWETSATVADKNALLNAMKRDKKNSSSRVRVILQRGLCDTIITEADDEEILKCL